jgi:hypothetical protein
MKRKNEMPTKFLSRYANITDDTNQTATGNQNTKYVFPYEVDLFEKCFVPLYMPQLIRIFVVFFKIPIRWRGNYEMDRLIRNE